MPLLYLREAEPFLPADHKQKMEQSVQAHFTKGMSGKLDKTAQRRLSKRSTSLIVTDAFVIIVEMLQVLALIQSMSLKWSYPESWIKYANFIFLFNLDAWEFIKVHSEAYTRVQGTETRSSVIPVDYNHILLAWLGFLVIVGTAFFVAYIIFRRRQSPYLLVHYSQMERVLLIVVQIFTLPLGTVVFRLFHCADGNVMAVFNSITCNKGLYWAYFIPALIVIVFLFGMFPLWLSIRIRKQKLAASTQHHEDYLQMKEVEYMAGLDVIWIVQGFHFFSSFTLWAAYYRPIVHTAKLILLIIFTAAFPYIYNQAIALSVILCLYALLIGIIRPFRVTSFNVVLGLSLACLSGDAIFGAVMTSTTPATVETPWLVEPYSYSVLIGINAVLAAALISWVIYLIARKLCCRTCFPNEPLWPVMASYEYDVEGMETYKFMAGILRGRAVLDSCIRAPFVFAPVHQLARQIEIINAFCREAEKTGDGVHTTLLQLLDDMTDVYRRLEPVSLFAETVKESIRQNAATFVEMMPAFSQRLAQRDYDLILVPPVKKRLLMKMSIIGMFVNGQRQAPVKDPLTQQALHKIWQELPDIVETRDEVEYREDLYPGPIKGPDMDNLYMAGTIDQPLELMELDESDEEESLATFLSRVPPVLMIKEESRRNSESSQTDLCVHDLEAAHPTEGFTVQARDAESQASGHSIQGSGSTTLIHTASIEHVAEQQELVLPRMQEEEQTPGEGFVNPAFATEDEWQEREGIRLEGEQVEGTVGMRMEGEQVEGTVGMRMEGEQVEGTVGMRMEGEQVEGTDGMRMEGEQVEGTDGMRMEGEQVEGTDGMRMDGDQVDEDKGITMAGEQLEVSHRRGSEEQIEGSDAMKIDGEQGGRKDEVGPEEEQSDEKENPRMIESGVGMEDTNEERTNAGTPPSEDVLKEG